MQKPVEAPHGSQPNLPSETQIARDLRESPPLLIRNGAIDPPRHLTQCIKKWAEEKRSNNLDTYMFYEGRENPGSSTKPRPMAECGFVPNPNSPPADKEIAAIKSKMPERMWCNLDFEDGHVRRIIEVGDWISLTDKFKKEDLLLQCPSKLVDVFDETCDKTGGILSRKNVYTVTKIRQSMYVIEIPYVIMEGGLVGWVQFKFETQSDCFEFVKKADFAERRKRKSPPSGPKTPNSLLTEI